jgi:lipoprotein-releasing system permease protein
MIAGKIPANQGSEAGNEILISEKLGLLLGFKTGDDLRMYFIIDNIARGRKFIISGIYNTGLAEFDEMYIFGDIEHIRNLNGWDDNLVSGIEINISDFAQLNPMADKVYQIIGYKLNTQTIKQLYPQIFDWIEIQDLNVVIILILMAQHCSF